MAHVVALDAQRRERQVESLLEGIEGPGPGVVVGGALEAVADELLLGVLGHGGLERPLVAPLGDPDPYVRAPEPRQPALVELTVVGVEGDEHLLGHPQGR